MAEDSRAGSGVPSTGRSDRSLDVAFDLLADNRRRDTLACLCERPGSIPLDELAEDVAARERWSPRTEPGDEEVRTAAVSLYHSHLPKLAGAGVVDYDRDRDLVTVSEDTDLLERFRVLARTGAADGSMDRAPSDTPRSP